MPSPTKLSKAVSRLTNRTSAGRQIILTMAPLGAQNDARVGVRLMGKRTQYVALLSDLYRVMALWHGQKEAAARKQARRDHIPWKRAKKQFIAANSI